MGIRLAVLVSLIACGGRPAAVGPQPDLDNMKMYEPFGMRAEAKLPDQAVILGTDDKGGSTVLRIPTAPGTASVDGFKLTTTPNNDGNVHVGVFETQVGAGGSQWRAGVWVAAIVAAHTLGKDLTDFTFSASASSHVDGPAASGLIAGGFLATMTGAKIDPQVTMIGVINPDGTIGPVTALHEKIEAALAGGKKKVGYPAGTSSARIRDLAKAKGAVAIEVANVHEVYKLLTGKPLPAPIPINDKAMAVEPATASAIDTQYKLWQTKLAAKSAALAEVEKAAHAQLGMLTASAKRNADQAAALHAKGVTGAAFARIVGAWLYATTAIDTHAVLARVKAGDLAGARTALDRVAQLDEGTALQRIAQLRPTTIGGHLLMMGAFQSALRGAGFASLARWRVEVAKQFLATLDGKSAPELATAASSDELFKVIAVAQLLVARSDLDSAVAVQRLEFEREKSLAYMCSIPNVVRLATSYRSASTAGMSYLDSLLVEPLAKSASISPDEARMRVASSEPDYLVAHALARLDDAASDIKTILGPTSLAWNLMLLAGAERAYLDAAQLTTKHYSFADQSHDAALATLLANADRAARSSARAAHVATGAIPVQAKLSYELALAQRDGDRDAKLDALASYWAATAYSQAAVMLARN